MASLKRPRGGKGYKLPRITDGSPLFYTSKGLHAALLRCLCRCSNSPNYSSKPWRQHRDILRFPDPPRTSKRLPMISSPPTIPQTRQHPVLLSKIDHPLHARATALCTVRHAALCCPSVDCSWLITIVGSQRKLYFLPIMEVFPARAS